MERFRPIWKTMGSARPRLRTPPARHDSGRRALVTSSDFFWRRYRHRLAQSRPRAGPISSPVGAGSATFVFFPARHASRPLTFSKGRRPFQKWVFCVGGVVKICKSGRFASTKRALAISGLGSNPPAQKKTSFRVDETQYFPGSAIRSSPPRARREARHKPG